MTIKKRIISDKELPEDIQLKKKNDLLKKWRQYLAERHQNDLDSSKMPENRCRFLCSWIDDTLGGFYAWKKRGQAARADYINKFYNSARLDSGLGYMAPIEYEQRVA